MSETKTVTIPIGYEAPAPLAQQERPAWARKSLHAVKMPRTEVQLEPEWVNNGPNIEVQWREVAPSEDTSSQPTQPYQQQGNFMDNQSGNQQQGGAQPPDPQTYDFYDSNDVARFHQDNAAYYQQVVDARVQSVLQPHMETLEGAKWERDYNATLARYGDDPNFKEIAQIAMERVVDEKGKISIMEAYQEADNKDRAKPGQKYSHHLPEALRDKKKGIGSLGKIMFHNAQTGRARPFGGRNWRG